MYVHRNIITVWENVILKIENKKLSFYLYSLNSPEPQELVECCENVLLGQTILTS